MEGEGALLGRGIRRTEEGTKKRVQELREGQGRLRERDTEEGRGNGKGEDRR